MFTEQSSNNLKVEKNKYVYENDTIKLIYDFWAEDGVMGFEIENKLDIPIYIDWKKSSFISSKNKFDYYLDRETTNSKSISAYRPFLFHTTIGNSEGTSVSIKEERITFIPPHAVSAQAKYKICSKEYIIMRGIKKSYLGDTKIKEKIRNFTSENAIISFRNFITYSTKENFEYEKYISNGFYVKYVIETKARKTDLFISPQKFYLRVPR